MDKIGLFYGSSSGNTKSAAKEIAKSLNIEDIDVYDIAKTSVNVMNAYNILIIGSSTWGYGDLQDDWDALIGDFEKLDLTGKKVAIFGTGDSESYPDTFCDSIGILAGIAKNNGATIIGSGVDSSDYCFDDSKALSDGTFCGLALDEDNESSKSSQRISNWIEKIKKEVE